MYSNKTVYSHILRAAVDKFSPGAQRIKAIEELAELIQALAKADNADNTAEEMADVRIMLDQLEIIFGNHRAVQSWTLKKMKRLDDLVHAADTVG